MTAPRRARRSKFLDCELIGDDRLSFILGLEDRGFSDEGDELIHALEVTGELALPSLEILKIEPRAIHHPYQQCGGSLEPVRQMVGTRIGPGFRARAIELMGRTKGCTHFMTLVLDLASAHTLSVFLRMRQKSQYARRNEPGTDWMRVGLEVEPRLENACIALQTSSPMLQEARQSEAKPPQAIDQQ